MVDRTLFVGNGFNMASDQGVGWNRLLNRLSGRPKDARETRLRKAKPFTLWFEEIATRSTTQRLKKTIAETLESNIKPNKLHNDILTLDIKNIITTNYDYNLENASGEAWRSSNTARETYYSLFRRNRVGQKYIWHIHGELDSIGSIMLGHWQYSGYLQKIRNFLTTGVPTEVKERSGRPYLSKFSRNSKGRSDVETWVDLFLESDLHIIGFGFDYTENHLWNLLIEKRRLQHQGYDVGSTVFHRCSPRKTSTADEARLSILQSLNVSVREHTATSFLAAYKRCIVRLAAS